MLLRSTTAVWSGVLVAMSLATATGGRAQSQPKAPTIAIESLAGSDSFALYCAPCHGAGGTGNGPVAGALRARPADLTTLARRNGGAFPGDTVRGFITGSGRALSAHGTTEMPIWGPMFRAFESDSRASERVANLVTHIESIQVPSTAPNDTGAQLFRTYCASCHGTDARGAGPLAENLRRPPPDLTQFTARNGGVFPSERVYRIIDGRDVPSHGDREMTVWGDAFRRTRGGSSDASVKSRIDAIVTYLASIQLRAAE